MLPIHGPTASSRSGGSSTRPVRRRGRAWVVPTALVIAVVVLGPSSPLASTDVGFRNVQKGAARTPTDVKLAKVDEYNERARSAGTPTISYQASWLRLPHGQTALDFVFEDLTAAQFEIVKGLYDDVSHSRPRAGKHDYRLVDFMPPLVQALDGHVFRYGAQELPEINAGRGPGAGQPPAVSDYIVTSANCWSTVYGLARTGGRPDRKATPSSFAVFYAGRFQAHDVFASLGTHLTEVAVPRGAEPAIPRRVDARTGDLLFVITESQLLRDVERYASGEIASSTPGRKLIAMEHAVVFIDEGLVFEKKNGGRDDPYRFVPLSAALAPYRDKPLALELRRVSGTLPHPRDVFGGRRYAVGRAYQEPIPDYLEPMLLLSKEITFPMDGEYHNSYSQVVDVSVRFDQATQRYVLGPDAYDSKTFDVVRNAKRRRASFTRKLALDQASLAARRSRGTASRQRPHPPRPPGSRGRPGASSPRAR